MSHAALAAIKAAPNMEQHVIPTAQLGPSPAQARAGICFFFKPYVFAGIFKARVGIFKPPFVCGNLKMRGGFMFPEFNQITYFVNSK